MKSILSKLFAKRGIESFDQLNEEEKTTFRTWDKILSKEDMTLDDLKQFIASQLAIIDAKFKDYNLTRVQKEELLPYYTVYKALHDAIVAPKHEREALEAYLIKQLEQ